MKKCINFILCFAVALSVHGQSKKEVKANKIKSVTTWNGDNEKGKALTHKESYNEYDKNGHAITKIEYNKDGSIKKKETVKYDAYGNKIEETFYDPDTKNIPKNIKRTCKYNAGNDKTEEVEYDNASGAIISKTIFTYNANGNKTTEMVYNAAGTLMKKIIYTYNSKKLKESRQVYNAAGVIISVKKYIYEYY